MTLRAAQRRVDLVLGLEGPPRVGAAVWDGDVHARWAGVSVFSRGFVYEAELEAVHRGGLGLVTAAPSSSSLF